VGQFESDEKRRRIQANLRSTTTNAYNKQFNPKGHQNPLNRNTVGHKAQSSFQWRTSTPFSIAPMPQSNGSQASAPNAAPIKGHLNVTFLMAAMLSQIKLANYPNAKIPRFAQDDGRKVVMSRFG
jgi:hypothetical protein